ncbi:MAG TPA: valine--tRNA ligase [Candidatus Pacearchaeota archaeon]|nr:valine--tRNA ligase [Candidatus Pacearchaeota archaeon]
MENWHEIEKKWQKYWEDNHIYKYDENSQGEIYSVDTPPPTISGKMHIGHASSYTHEDVVVRFERMKGKKVIFPFGTDDNGLPTERFVEKEKNVSLKKMQRSEFIELCNKTLEEIRPQFIQNWKDIGMSCDFTLEYSTINKECQKISQKYFIDLFNKDLAYKKETPILWCPLCGTAVAQAELEDKNIPSVFYSINFDLEDGEYITIATTRPELLSSCVAIFVNPEDERYKNLIGKKVITPIFNDEVEIKADGKVDKEKGTGIVMCCTFGDTTDIEWYMEHNLPLKTSISKEGRMTELAKEFEGLKIKEARQKIIEKLKNEGRIVEEKPIEHLVNIHERCGTEIEILPTSQWFIKILENKARFIERGREINWNPNHLVHRYENWINNLKWDWCISRQRFFGIPFPVWFCEKCGEIIIADENDLPVDPLKQKPNKKCKCGSESFIGEKDVMDTWATSSLTPQILENLVHKKLIPTNLRAQAHDIISTWLFYTVVRSEYIENKIPWKEVLISGFVLDPKGEKMSKSKGNIVEPKTVIEKYGADALRYWATNTGWGKDIKYDENELKNGRKLITKIINASNFASKNLSKVKPNKLYILDQYFLIKLNKVIKEIDGLFEKREISQVRTLIEKFFWNSFCDNYLELSKWRVYGENEELKDSAKYTLYHSLLTIIKMFAPIIPFTTEEIYQNYFIEQEKTKSIHLTRFPEFDNTLIDQELEKKGDLLIKYLEEVRKIKSEKGVSQKTEIDEFKIIDDIGELEKDLKETGNIKNIIKA